MSGLRCVLRIIGLVDYLGHPQSPQRTGHGCTVGVNRDSRYPRLSSCSLITLPRLKHPHLHTCLRHREHVPSTRIASPCFARLRFQLRLSSRAPPDSTTRDRSTWSNWSRLASTTMYQPCKCFTATIFEQNVLTTRESCDLAMVS